MKLKLTLLNKQSEKQADIVIEHNEAPGALLDRVLDWLDRDGNGVEPCDAVVQFAGTLRDGTAVKPEFPLDREAWKSPIDGQPQTAYDAMLAGALPGKSQVPGVETWSIDGRHYYDEAAAAEEKMMEEAARAWEEVKKNGQPENLAFADGENGPENFDAAAANPGPPYAEHLPAAPECRPRKLPMINNERKLRVSLYDRFPGLQANIDHALAGNVKSSPIRMGEDKSGNPQVKFRARYNCPRCGNKGQRYISDDAPCLPCHNCNEKMELEPVGKLPAKDYVGGHYFDARYFYDERISPAPPKEREE